MLVAMLIVVVLVVGYGSRVYLYSGEQNLLSV